MQNLGQFVISELGAQQGSDEMQSNDGDIGLLHQGLGNIKRRRNQQTETRQNLDVLVVFIMFNSRNEWL